MRVTLIGSGNVATVLGRKIFHSGHIIHQVYSTNKNSAAELAKELSAVAVDDIDDGADFYLIAVPDDALMNIRTWLKPVNKFMVHTAGSVKMDVLKEMSGHYGVLWPLQSLRKETAAEPVLPLLIDANNPWNRMKLTGFAQSFGDSVNVANDEERRKLHLAAVITNNFSNYLFSMTEKYCENEGVDFKLLHPLLYETVNRLGHNRASELQTGPAVRNDKSTIQKHREMLRGDVRLLEMYDWFTTVIVNRQS